MKIYWFAINFGLFATPVRVIRWLGVSSYGLVFNLLFLWLSVAGCGSVLPEITNLGLSVGGCGSVWPGVGGCGSVFNLLLPIGNCKRRHDRTKRTKGTTTG